MNSGKKIKTTENESDENLPFDIYDSDYPTRIIPSKDNSSYFMDSKLSVRNASNTVETALNEYDVDDEEDFISKYIMTCYLLLKIKSLETLTTFSNVLKKNTMHLFEQFCLVFNLWPIPSF